MTSCAARARLLRKYRWSKTRIPVLSPSLDRFAIMFVPVFTLNLNQKLLPGRVSIGSFDGERPCLVAATVAEKVTQLQGFSDGRLLGWLTLIWLFHYPPCRPALLRQMKNWQNSQSSSCNFVKVNQTHVSDRMNNPVVSTLKYFTTRFRIHAGFHSHSKCASWCQHGPDLDRRRRWSRGSRRQQRAGHAEHQPARDCGRHGQVGPRRGPRLPPGGHAHQPARVRRREERRHISQGKRSENRLIGFSHSIKSIAGRGRRGECHLRGIPRQREGV